MATLLRQASNGAVSPASVADYNASDRDLSTGTEHPLLTSRPSGLVSKEAAAAVETVIFVGVLPVLAVTGIGTNVLNMAIFARLGLGDRINLCLFSLSLADLGYLVFLMAGKSHSVLTLLNPSLGQYWKSASLHTVVGVYWALMNISSAITMIISLERCACVLAPLRAKSLIRTRSMLAVIVVVFVSIMGLYGLYSVKYVTLTRVDPARGNRTTYVTSMGSFYIQHRTIIDVIYQYVLSFTVPTTSLIVVIITTTITTIQLHLSLSWRQQSAQQSIRDKREVALTRMLVAVCCVYVVCVTPKSIMAVVMVNIPDLQATGRYRNLFYMVNAFMHMLSAVNSSVNFFFYVTLGTRYHATLLSLCPWCWATKEKSDS